MNQPTYRCKDRSWLTTFLDRVALSILTVFPKNIPAYVLSIFANLLAYIGLGLSFIPNKEAIVAFCLLSMLLGNRLAYLHAQQTTFSPLYEFVAHGLGTFQNGVLLIISLNIFHIEKLSLIAYFFTVSYTAHAAVLYEQLKTGWIVFEKIGAKEFTVALVLMILTNLFEGVKNAWQMVIYQDYVLIETAFFLFSLVALLTAIQALVRVYKENGIAISRSFAMFCIWFSLIGAACSLLFSEWVLTLVMTLYGGVYLIGLLRGHLLDETERHPDLVLPLLLVARFSMLLPLQHEWLIVVVVLYLCFAIIWQIV
ncbi:MAG: hypothetical protein NZ521_09335, partial [Flammeovirgaceae bacterium]|nr:hypothetical protein [Flammeovirgaceae bacterium]MDW8288598.1 hypothetical protein [Flammeovirgaceae bacterium]